VAVTKPGHNPSLPERGTMRLSTSTPSSRANRLIVMSATGASSGRRVRASSLDQSAVRRVSVRTKAWIAGSTPIGEHRGAAGTPARVFRPRALLDSPAPGRRMPHRHRRDASGAITLWFSGRSQTPLMSVGPGCDRTRSVRVDRWATPAF
jgi:hypothetical protein